MKNPTNASATRNCECCQAPTPYRGRREAPRGASERDLGFPPGVLRHAAHADHRAHERDEERRRGPHALAAEREDVAHLVREDQRDEPDAEPPAAEQRVGADRDEHRAGDRDELELVDDRAELGQECAQAASPPQMRRPNDGFAGSGSGATTIRYPDSVNSGCRRSGNDGSGAKSDTASMVRRAPGSRRGAQGEVRNRNEPTDLANAGFSRARYCAVVA